MDPDSAHLSDVAAEAWKVGQTINLDDVGYGKAHWGDETEVTAPLPYYYFLAGIARLIGARNILEIGTHHGGSARAMLKGSRVPQLSRVLTFDIEMEGSLRLKDCPQVKACVMDANSPHAFRLSINHFAGERIDLCFLDAAHSAWPTLTNFVLYARVLKPRFVVLDDIRLNPSMRQAWALIQSEYGEDTLDVSELTLRDKAYEPTDPGFGLVRMR